MDEDGGRGGGREDGGVHREWGLDLQKAVFVSSVDLVTREPRTVVAGEGEERGKGVDAPLQVLFLVVHYSDCHLQTRSLQL